MGYNGFYPLPLVPGPVKTMRAAVCLVQASFLIVLTLAVTTAVAQDPIAKAQELTQRRPTTKRSRCSTRCRRSGRRRWRRSTPDRLLPRSVPPGSRSKRRRGQGTRRRRRCRSVLSPERRRGVAICARSGGGGASACPAGHRPGDVQRGQRQFWPPRLEGNRAAGDAARCDPQRSGGRKRPRRLVAR